VRSACPANPHAADLLLFLCFDQKCEMIQFRPLVMPFEITHIINFKHMCEAVLRAILHSLDYSHNIIACSLPYACNIL